MGGKKESETEEDADEFSLTLPVVHFEDSEARHIVSQNDPVGSCGLVHTLDDLKVPVSEVQVVVIDSHAPGVGQTTHYGDAVGAIGITALNLWRFTPD